MFAPYESGLVKNRVCEGEDWKKRSALKELSVEERDSIYVDEISELFTSIETEGDQDIDFDVFIEDEDAINVEELSGMFTALEDGASEALLEELSPLVSVSDAKPSATSHEESVEDGWESEDSSGDAANVDFMAELFSSLEETVEEEVPECPVSQQDIDDAADVDIMADLFTTLESTEDVVLGLEVVSPEETSTDASDAAQVDDMALLFAELEEIEVARQAAAVVEAVPCAAPVATIDSRVFVPGFAVKIEGRRPVVSAPAAGFRCGPPAASFLVGPPRLSAAASDLTRDDRVGRWREKRKSRSWAPKQPDASISDVRRATAAKRQRTKGRFTSEKPAFVSITCLQK